MALVLISTAVIPGFVNVPFPSMRIVEAETRLAQLNATAAILAVQLDELEALAKMAPAKLSPPSSCKDLYERGERKDGPYDLTFSDGTSEKVYCDMTTVDGGWTMVAKVKGQGTTMNRLNQHQWRDGTILGNSDDLSDVDALTQAYSSVPFTDVLIRGLTTGEKHVAWSHPNQYDSMKAVNNGCERISDGVRLSGRVANLDLLDGANIAMYGSADGSTECPALKYGFFGFDWNDYRETQIAGCANKGNDASACATNAAACVTNGPSSAAHGAVGAANDNERMVGGHSGGFIAISTFKRTATESGVNCLDKKLTDFGVGAGYHNMDAAIEKEAINAHNWGHGNANTHGFKTHAVFVR